MAANIDLIRRLPAWVPEAVRLYLSHTEDGLSLRALARREGCHPSTILRRVRRFEGRRDDPLVDEALTLLGQVPAQVRQILTSKERFPMNASARTPNAAQEPVADDEAISRDACRILRRLCESGAQLAIAPDMERAVVLRQCTNGKATRIAVLDRAVAQAFALKEWIACSRAGRVALYEITPVGRAALRRLLAGRETRAAGASAGGFADQHREWDEREISSNDGAGTRRMRFNLAESPVALLARRRDRSGKPFLAPELVAAAERLREDFELAQMGPRVAQNWDRFLTGGQRGTFDGQGPGEGPRAARDRVAAALRDLGPGLGDVALRCCCFLEGLEATERRMGWSARSGKIVLRIALQRLRRHYEENGGLSRLIG